MMRKTIADLFDVLNREHLNAYRQYRQKKCIDDMRALFGENVEFPVGWKAQIDTRLADVYLAQIGTILEGGTYFADLTFQERIDEAIVQLSICMDLTFNFPIIEDSIRMVISKLNYIKEVV